MGTLGCINDMLQRDKENRELRKRNRERLRPLVNDNHPGTYRVIKEIGFFDSRQDWYTAAEFRIE